MATSIQANKTTVIALSKGDRLSITGEGAWSYYAFDASGLQLDSGSYADPDVIGPFSEAGTVNLTASAGSSLSYDTLPASVGNATLDAQGRLLGADGGVVLDVGAAQDRVEAELWVTDSMFGGDGTGSRDSLAAVNLAFDVAVSSGIRRVVVPPNSRIRLSNRLLIPSGIEFCGYGDSSEVFFDWVSRAVSTEYIRNADTSGAASNISIKSLKIIGSGPGVPHGTPLPGDAGTTVTGILMRRVNGLTIQDVSITRTTGISIAYQGCRNVKITGNRIYETGRDGITGSWWNSRLEDVVVANNIIRNIGDDGIAIISSEDVANTDQRPRRISITGNVICTQDAYTGSTATVSISSGSAVCNASSSVFSSADVGKAIVVPGAGAAGADLIAKIQTYTSPTQVTLTVQASTTVSNVSALYSHAAGRGILCIGGEDIAISGNSINNTFAAGIYVYDDQSGSLFKARRMSISGNSISNAGATGDATQYGNGIRCTGVDDVSITGNSVSASRESGIYVGKSSGAVVSSNSVSDCGTSCTATKIHYGIEINGTAGVLDVMAPSISGNTVKRSAGGGIMVAFARHATVSGNTVYDNGLLGNGTLHNASGIVLFGGGEAVISANNCTDTKASGSKLQTFGIAYLSGYDSAELTLDANMCIGNKSYGINFAANPNYAVLSGNVSTETFNLGSLSGTAALVKRGNYESSTVSANFDRDPGGTTHRTGAGTPEGAIAATVGSTYRRTDGGAGTAFYVKETGTGNTGWVAK